jgi:ABC-type multidrug transport system ATPase subunit/pSer/pThr/pTyr-binding forkhead associated (FHA) protein
MSRPPPTTITVCSGAVRRTFPPGRDVIVGSDIRADLRIPHPAISRAHTILRCVDGQWTAIDNDSPNGMFEGTERVRSVALLDLTAINLGSPQGPRLTFDLRAALEWPTVETNRSTLQKITIGRAADNDIDVSDVMASRHHATLVATPSGPRLYDAHSANGTFVNGCRIKNKALQENDVVTIGSADFVFADGSLARRTQAAATTGGLEVHDVGSTLRDGDVTLMDRVSLAVRPGALTAVIGPSGSAKSTLLRVMVGARRPSSGAVKLDGRDLYAQYDSLRSRIGMVPHDDIAHGTLTVGQALNFAARLRIPPDATKEERRQIVSRVLEELELIGHADTRVDELPGGQRKRVSVAIELLTEPSLLVLDEPTTGRDPALDKQVMVMLRRLADAGRGVVVVTHSLRFLDVCDQVLLLAPGGKTAYRGSPDGVAEAMGSADWADIYDHIRADPDGAQRRYFERHGVAPAPVSQSAAAASWVPRKFGLIDLWRQASVIGQRQVSLLVADRRHLAFVVLAPIVVGLLALGVDGDAGFTEPRAGTPAPFEPRQIIVLLSFAAILMGLTLSVRDLIGERAIYRHEQAAGLSPSAYLLAKITVFGAVAAIQSAVLVLVVTVPGVGKPAPTTAAALGSPTLELFVDVAATAVAAAVLGLAISAVSLSSNQYLPLLAVACVAQLVLAGSLFPVTGRPALEAIAALAPAHWGVAAMASSVDLASLVPMANNPLWRHSASVWLLDIGMLAALVLLYTLFVRWTLRRKVTV